MYFLNINKPKGISSFDVIRKLRKILQIKQIGHSGTLDPLASGVLQVAVGRACKLLDYLSSDKEYIADIKFGYVSTTFDDEGEKTFVLEPSFSKKELIAVLNSFLGETFQVPPKYSAIKIDGKKLCDVARKNKDFEIDIPKRKIYIYSIELLDFTQDTAKIKVLTKKGTYIRSLVDDIGKKLGCGAYMSDLVRTKAGDFLLQNSDELNQSSFIRINPCDALNLNKIELNDKEYELISNGNFIPVKNLKDNDVVLLTKNNKLVSIAKISDNLIKPKKNFKED